MSDVMTWPVDIGLLPEVNTDEEKARLQQAIDSAVLVLWRLTGSQFSIHRLLARPCPRNQDGDMAGFTPVLYEGRWFNVACNTCQSDGPGAIHLPGPVAAIERVEVEGVTIASESYALENDRLIRAGGRSWPSQNLQRELGSPGTWGVIYLRGVQPPAGAAASVSTLATEFYQAASGGKCRLPKAWQTVQRQGVTITRMDPTDLLAAGKTGLPEVDLWVRAINPHGIARGARVASPDTIGGR